MKTISVIVIALAMLIALTGAVMADQVVPAVPEAQAITTSTAVIADGLVMETDALAWSLSNQHPEYHATRLRTDPVHHCL